MTQTLSPQQMQDIGAVFQRRYEPQFSAGTIVSRYQMLPQSRAVWPFSSVDENGDVYDITGQGRVMNNQNSVPFSFYGLYPYADLTAASSHYFSRPSEAGFLITDGLTLGGWFYSDGGNNDAGLSGKWDENGDQRSYLLRFAWPTVYFQVSDDGINPYSVSAGIDDGAWYHVVGRFATNSIDIFVNGVKTNNAVGIPAAIFVSTANFEIGAYNGADKFFDGRISLNVLCAAALSDTQIWAAYQQDRALFGV